MPSRWSMPREYVSALVSARSVMPTCSRTSSIFRSASAGARPFEPSRVAEVLAAGHAVVEPDGVRQVANVALDLEGSPRRVEADDASPAA